MIKAVLFDYGGVLTESGKVGNIQRVLGQIYGIDPKSIDMQELHDKLKCGTVDEQTFFDTLNERYGKHVSADAELFAARNQGFFTRSQSVYELAEQLRKAGIKTGILSNVYQMTADRLRAQGFYDGFDPVVLSCEQHMAKPDAAFFEAARQQFGVKGSEILFIDDQERFRPVAESLGMRFITAVSPGQIVQDVKHFLLKENNLRLGAA